VALGDVVHDLAHRPSAVAVRRLDLLVEEQELARRREAWRPPERKDDRGYRRLYEDRVLQANEGCDFDFLEGDAPIPEPEIH